MPRLLSILLLAIPALCAGGSAGIGKNPVSLLPDGSVLKGVLLPRYDDDRRLIGDLKAETMVLIDPQRIQGENVRIRFYHPDRSVRGKVDLKNALFDQAKSRLSAKEKVEITNDRLTARGTGLVYDFQDGKGFLSGPASTWVSAIPKTTHMNANPLSKATLIALCFSPLPLMAIPPTSVTDEEMADIRRAAETSRPEIEKCSAESETILRNDITRGEDASAAAIAYINASGIQSDDTTVPAQSAEAKPLATNPGPDDTLITCEGGMYFDADEGVLVYLKNVVVKDPRFDLTGADELKVFFEQKSNNSEQKETTAMGGFGDVKKLIATGTVSLRQKSVGGKDPVEASGGLLTYDIPTGEIIISGRYPWVKQGSYFARAMEPNLRLRLLNNGSFSTKGNWQMGANLKLNGR